MSLETAKEYCEWYTTLHEGDDHGVILHGDKIMTQYCSATIDIDTNTDSIRALIKVSISVRFLLLRLFTHQKQSTNTHNKEENTTSKIST